MKNYNGSLMIIIVMILLMIGVMIKKYENII
jgi:hypothetical protein